MKTNTKSQHVGFLESVATGDAAKIIALIERCVDINASDRTGRTALHLASSEGHCNIIELLIQRGVLLKKDLNLQDNQGHETLQEATMNGHRYAAQALVKAGARLSEMARITLETSFATWSKSAIWKE